MNPNKKNPDVATLGVVYLNNFGEFLIVGNDFRFYFWTF